METVGLVLHATPSARTRFDVLDSWRGIAACMVALHHLPAYSHFHEAPLLRNAYLFVDLFFVLSGFVIASTYRLRLAQGLAIWRFALLRFGRLYPLHFVMLLLLAALAAALQEARGRAFPGLEFVASAALVQNFLVGAYTLNTPSWSISVEFWTYLIFAALARAGQRPLLIAMGIAALLGPPLIAAAAGNMDVITDYSMIRCLAGFACGVLLNAGYRERQWGTVPEVLAIAAVCGFVMWSGDSVASVAAPYLFSAVLLIYAPQSGAVSRLLAKPVFLFLGAISYSIYMVHWFICLLTVDLLHAAALRGYDWATRTDKGFFIGTEKWQGDLAYPLYLALVLSAACLAHRCIEAPWRERFRHLAMRSSARPAPHRISPTSSPGAR